MRKVKFTEHEYIKFNEVVTSEKEGFFHEFGCDFEELEFGVGSYSTAIIQMADGSIKNIPVEQVVFND